MAQPNGPPVRVIHPVDRDDQPRPEVTTAKARARSLPPHLEPLLPLATDLMTIAQRVARERADARQQRAAEDEATDADADTDTER
jgi:hypothetical protein